MHSHAAISGLIDVGSDVTAIHITSNGKRKAGLSVEIDRLSISIDIRNLDELIRDLEKVRDWVAGADVTEAAQ